MPVTTQFDVFDWNARFDTLSPPYGGGITDVVEGLLASARHNGTALGSADAVVVASFAADTNVTATSSVSLDFVPTQDSTLEVEFSGVHLPATWSDRDTRVFIGLHGTTYSAGILVTANMLLLARSIDDPSPLPLHGSGRILHAGTSVVVRLIVDSEAKRVGIYYGGSPDVYTEDACAGDWRKVPLLTQQHNLPLPVGIPSNTRVAIETRASAGSDVAIAIESLRLASSMQVPYTRPTAVLETTSQVALSGMTWLDGARSHDTAGASLEYRWSVLERPKGSQVRLQGHTLPVASTAVTPTGGTTPVTTPADIVFTRAAIDNGYSVRFVVSGTNTPYRYALQEKVLTVTVATDVGGSPTTTAEEVLRSFQVPANGLFYDAAVAQLFTCRYAMLGATGYAVVHACDVAFAEGYDSNLPSPAFVPDLVGPYRFRLRVSNGGVFSPGVDTYVHCVPVEIATGYRPDTSYVFKYLPDFWDKVKNKEHLEAVWSGAAQLMASEIERVWQNDYSKSIRDISRKYSRRWLSFSTRVDLSAATIVTPSTCGTANITWPANAYGATTQASVDAPLVAGPALYRSTERAPTVVTVSGPTATSASITPAFTGYRQLLAGSAGAVVDATPYAGQLRVEGEYLGSLSTSTDVLEVRLPSGVLDRQSISSVAVNTSTITSTHSYGATGDSLDWRVLRRVERHTLQQQPYVSVPAGAFTDMPQMGDVVELTVLDPSSGLSRTIYVPVVVASPRVLLVQWDEYVRYLNASDGLQGLPAAWTASKAAGTVTAVVRLIRCTTLPAYADLQHVPTLGSTLSRDHYEGVEYGIMQGAPTFHRLLEYDGVSYDGANVLPYMPGMPQDDVGGQYVHVQTGVDAGVYFAQYERASSTDVHLRVAYKFTANASVSLSVPRFSPGLLPDGTLWGEVGYFDNWRTIQNNFGVLVGMPKADLDTAGVTADYLQVVKSLAYGFVCGPTLENIGRVGDAFSSLPFVEHDSQVVDLMDPTEDAPGYVVLLNPYGRLVRHTWPYGIALAQHPITGAPITAFPVMDSYSSDIMSMPDFINSRLPAYTRLFGAVEALDYVLDPERVDGVLASLYGPTGILRRYRTVVLRVPLGQFDVTAGLNLLMRHVQEMAGADTFVVVLGVQQRFDDVPVFDYVHRRTTLLVHDTPGTPALTSSDNTTGSALLPFTFPQDPGKQFADGPFVHEDGAARYGSSYEVGMDDAYSGHGSVSLHGRAPDMVNHTASTGLGDIDVLSSTLWVPITKLTADYLAESEFHVGDVVRVLRDGIDATGEDVPDYCWDVSPPTILHIGSPEHPGLYGLPAPQNAHPVTYVLLGFRGQTVELADPRRLDAIAYVRAAFPLADLTLTNGAAYATVDVVPSVAGTPELYDLDYCYREDRGADLNPEDILTIKRIAYVPAGGMLADDFALAISTADGLQQASEPYPAATVPSFGPGAFTQWSDAAPGVTNMRWDYEAPQLLSGPDLSNVHMAIATAARKKRHKTHGFVRGGQQPPELYSIEALAPDVYAAKVRVEGWYFQDALGPFAPDDPADAPLAAPNTGWVFAQYEFAEGMVGWIPMDGGLFITAAENSGVVGTVDADQPSRGHVYEAHWDVGTLTTGHRYRVIVATRQLYSMTGVTSGATLQVKLDYVASTALFTAT